jgi:hypothetical protein
MHDAVIRRQTWKCYFVLCAWPAYLFVAPYVYARYGMLMMLFAVFPGAYLFTWLSLLTHETWHKAIPNIPNRLLYVCFSWMLLTDPQLYSLLHSFHHSHIHSWDDVEFHPFGNVQPRPLRIVANLLEIVFGMIYVVAAYCVVVPRHPQCRREYRYWKSAVTIVIGAFLLLSTGYMAQVAFAVRTLDIVVSYVLSYWVGSLFVRHSQLVEHGNLIVDADWHTRSLHSRNLNDSGLLAKIFLFLTHGDAREHVLHHTSPHIYARPFPGHWPMPGLAVYITLRDYGKILADMVAGRASSF